MKVDLTYKGCDIVTSLKRIVDSKKLSTSPVIILWNDSPKSEVQLVKYISSNRHYYFIRIGVVCSGAVILDEVYYQLTSRHYTLRNSDLKVSAISKFVQNTKHPLVFVVASVHLISADQISWLTGLIYEFTLKARFIFILHKDHFNRLIHSKKGKDSRFKYFLEQIKLIYALDT